MSLFIDKRIQINSILNLAHYMIIGTECLWAQDGTVIMRWRCGRRFWYKSTYLLMLAHKH